MDSPTFPSAIPEALVTVEGPIDPLEAGITDAHNHLWIARVEGTASDVPVLNDRAAIAAELTEFRSAGGRSIVDCQPWGCGRDANILRKLAVQCGVHIVACGGFHLRRYYPPDHWLFEATSEQAQAYFVRELCQSLEETADAKTPVRAGFLKVACEETLDRSPLPLLEGAAQACLDTGAAMMVHTERGSDAERIIAWLQQLGLKPGQIVLCHMDKRSDYPLHAELAREGAMLEYDTFFRPQYRPDEQVWPLLEQMVHNGLDSLVAVATDMADSRMWSRLGGGPGLTGLVNSLVPRMYALGFGEATIQGLAGGNIASRLAHPAVQSL